MKTPMLPAAKRFLRSPRCIVGQIAGLALLCAMGAVLPQAGSASPAELTRLRESGPVLHALVGFFGLDHIFRSVGFVGLTLLTTCSLLLVVVEQVRRLRASWSQRLTAANFQTAPLRAEFERPAGLMPGGQAGEPRSQFWTEKRFGLAGSVILHLGLLLVIAAGAARALFGTDAVVDLMEGETLQPTAAAWAAQWPGVLAKPFRLHQPVTLTAVQAIRHAGGELRELKVQLAVPQPAQLREAELAVNRDLQLPGGRLFLGSGHGPAALVEWQKPGIVPVRDAALLHNHGQGTFEGASSGPDDQQAYLRAHVNCAGDHPGSVEVRVMKNSVLLFAGDARVGETLSLPGGQKLILRGIPFWARLQGSRDPALWLAYAGFALILAGVTLIFTLVKVDGCLIVTPIGDRERVFVALKPHRFAPLFEERFQRLVDEQVAAGGSCAQMHHSVHPDHKNGHLSLRLMAWLLPSRFAGWLFLLLCVPFLTSCQKSSAEQARALVERYNKIVSEAYRRGDVRLIDPVVGPREGKKLTGLIGVRLDFGLTLDSHLLSLEVTGVEQAKNVMRVATKERWRYRDLRIGSGKQVGEESLDSYEMLYFFTNINKAWLVDEIRFTRPPWVGRSQTAWAADRKVAPAMARATNLPKGAHP
jgi:hypothetical protein